eukprot:gene4974-5785_t
MCVAKKTSGGIAESAATTRVSTGGRKTKRKVESDEDNNISPVGGIDVDDDDDDFKPTTTTTTTKRTRRQLTNEEKEAKKQTKEDEKRRKEEAKPRTKLTIFKEMHLIFDPAIYVTADVNDLIGQIVAKKADITLDSANTDIGYSIQWHRIINGLRPIIEKYVVLRYPNEILHKMVVEKRLQSDIEALCLKYPKKSFILLVENLDGYITIQSNNIAKAIQSQNRSGSTAPVEGISSQGFINRQKFEEIFIKLQIQNNVMVRMLSGREESADYLIKLTEIIGMNRYKTEVADLFEGFCPDAIKKRYKEPRDIWLNQLMMVQGVSQNVAQSITIKYPSLPSLYADYLRAGMTDHSRATLLKDIKIESNSTSTQSKRLGPVLSQRIYEIFYSTDGNKYVQ